MPLLSTMFKSGSLIPLALITLPFLVTTHPPLRRLNHIPILLQISQCLAYLHTLGLTAWCDRFRVGSQLLAFLEAIWLFIVIWKASRDGASSCYIPHMMLTCAMKLKLAIFNAGSHPSELRSFTDRAYIVPTLTLWNCHSRLLYHTKSRGIEEMPEPPRLLVTV